jgi:hypothetical protein
VEERNYMFMTTFRLALGSPPNHHSNINSNSGGNYNTGLEHLQHETDHHLLQIPRPHTVIKVPNIYLVVVDINQSIVLETSQGYISGCNCQYSCEKSGNAASMV